MTSVLMNHCSSFSIPMKIWLQQMRPLPLRRVRIHHQVRRFSSVWSNNIVFLFSPNATPRHWKQSTIKCRCWWLPSIVTQGIEYIRKIVDEEYHRYVVESDQWRCSTSQVGSLSIHSFILTRFPLKNVGNQCPIGWFSSRCWPSSSSFRSWYELYLIESHRYDFSESHWCVTVEYCLVMASPRENPSELSGRQSAELIRDLLDTKHAQSYMLFSLDQVQRGQPSYRKEIFHNRVRGESIESLYCFFSSDLGHRFTIVGWKACTTFHWSFMSLSKDQFISTGISSQRRRTSLFGKHFFLLISRKSGRHRN